MERDIPGLRLIESFISETEEGELLRQLGDDGPWETEPSVQCRRVQHYGYRYHVNTKEVSEARPFSELPQIARSLGARIGEHVESLGQGPNQVTVNEYRPGQSIVMHSDHPALGPWIATLSTGAEARMRLRRAGEREERDILIPARSLTVLTGTARYLYRHGIAVGENAGTATTRRVALTYRMVSGPWRR